MPFAKYGNAKRPPGVADMCQRIRRLDAPSNVESSGLTKDDRKVYYDIYCHSSDGRDFIVEMQHIGLKYYRDRVLFYATYPIMKQHTEAKLKFLAHNHDEKFNWDYHLYPVYVISIVDFVMEHCESWPRYRFHSQYIMKEEEYNEPYSNTFYLYRVTSF